MANGASRKILKVILDPQEEAHQEANECVELSYSPSCILINLKNNSGKAVGHLEPGIIPIFPSEQSFQITLPGQNGGKPSKKNVKCCQVPLTGSYALTDY